LSNKDSCVETGIDFSHSYNLHPTGCDMLKYKVLATLL